MSVSQEDDGNMREKLVSILQIQHHSKHPKTKFTKKAPDFLTQPCFHNLQSEGKESNS